ncbi:MAG: class I SAM-dependent methyltransferase [Pseudomonadota bacterium]
MTSMLNWHPKSGIKKAIVKAGGIRDEVLTAHPNGHFYSPVVNPSSLSGDLWSDRSGVAGIDFCSDRHRLLLSDWFPRHLPHFDYPFDEPEDPSRYFVGNSQFSWLDARTLFVFLRELRPKRMVEVGSGFSSLLSADVNHRFLNDEMDLTCIEPFPRPFLTTAIAGLNRVVTEKVENVDLTLFGQLESGDILFIDSSHVAKTGSDVNHLFFEVIPRLSAGVFFHIHDIFLPGEYPREWVVNENRSWNEQYLLQAFLMFNQSFEVFFGCSYAHRSFPDLVGAALGLGGQSFGGGSMWIRRTST